MVKDLLKLNIMKAKWRVIQLHVGHLFIELHNVTILQSPLQGILVSFYTEKKTKPETGNTIYTT